jgi:hypothetical protein
MYSPLQMSTREVVIAIKLIHGREAELHVF